MRATIVRRIMTAWLALVAAVFIASLLSAAAPPGAWGLDKIVHFAVFLVLAVAPAVVLPRGWALFCAVMFLAMVGLGIEVAQSFIPGRVGSGDDFFADAVGVMAGVVLGRLVWRRLRAAKWIENAGPDPQGQGR